MSVPLLQAHFGGVPVLPQTLSGTYDFSQLKTFPTFPKYTLPDPTAGANQQPPVAAPPDPMAAVWRSLPHVTYNPGDTSAILNQYQPMPYMGLPKGALWSGAQPMDPTAALGLAQQIFGGGGGGQPIQGGPGVAAGQANAQRGQESGPAATSQGLTQQGPSPFDFLNAQIFALQNTPLQDMSGVALQRALQTIAPSISALQAQQGTLSEQGRQQAMNILAAGRAAAGLGAQNAQVLQGAYNQAANETKNIAQGYTGALRGQALSDATALQQQVKAAGGTLPANVGGIDLANMPTNAANALYSLAGAIPATSLADQATSAMKIAQSYPGILEGGSTQAALMAQAAKQQQALALNAQIQAQTARIPGLETSYATQLQNLQLQGKKFQLQGLQATGKILRDQQMGNISQQNANTRIGSLVQRDDQFRQRLGLEWTKYHTGAQLDYAKLIQNSNLENARLIDAHNFNYLRYADEHNYHVGELNARNKEAIISVARLDAMNANNAARLDLGQQRNWISLYKATHPTSSASSASLPDRRGKAALTQAQSIINGEQGGVLVHGKPTKVVPPVIDLKSAIDLMTTQNPWMTPADAVRVLITAQNANPAPSQGYASSQGVTFRSYQDQWNDALNASTGASVTEGGTTFGG